MSSFEESLRKTVFGIGQDYTRAVEDLVAETNEASDAVDRVTGGIAHLTLRTLLKDAEETVFVLNVASRTGFSEICAFFVSSRGYPMRVASSRDAGQARLWEEYISDRDAIRKYLTDLASNPESRLSLRIAFLMRQQEGQA